jgi:hypothetical protein
VVALVEVDRERPYLELAGISQLLNSTIPNAERCTSVVFVMVRATMQGLVRQSQWTEKMSMMVMMMMEVVT